MGKRKIAIFGVKYFPSKGGTSRVVEKLILGLKDEFEITIYCYSHDLAANYIPSVKTIQFPEIPIKGFGVFLYFLRCCVHLMCNGHYDLVHMHKTEAAFFLPILSRKFKVITTSHALPHLNDKWSKFGKLYFKVAERMYIQSKGVLTSISKAQVKYFMLKYNRSVQFVPNGISNKLLFDQQKAENILKGHNVNSQYLLFSARRLIPLKGCHYLLEALKLLDYRGTLLVLGDPEQVPSYTNLLKRESIGLNVKFIGYISDLYALNSLIKGAELFIFPSEIEGMSMMLLEVAMIGTPMICSDIPQNKDIFGTSEVLYFESKNASDLAEKLNWALQNRGEMKLFADRAKSVVHFNYIIDNVIAQYKTLYEELLSNENLS